MPGWVAITDAPEYMRERGGGGREGCGLRSTISAVIYTSIHQSRGRRHTMPGWVAITDAPVYMRERGGGGRGGCGLRSAISAVSRYT